MSVATAFGGLGRTFLDPGVTVEDQIVAGDKVVERWSTVGTHEGEFMGIPATGNKVTVTGIDISRLEDGKVVEHWTEMDVMGMMQQLGAVPSA
jgi:predicted ester cyclase